MVQSLLTQKNTPDPVCYLSPTQILLGWNFKDSLPYIRKSVMVYNNSQILKIWRNAWSIKEEALRSPYVKSLENLSEHTKSLPPLNCGDHVIIQNQAGNFPNKWGKSGIILELKDYHQYAVKIDGSGRLTLRNRKFLGKFNPPVYDLGVVSLIWEKQTYHCRSLSFLAMPRKEIPRKVLMVCTPRKEYVLKLKITLARFATQKTSYLSFIWGLKLHGWKPMLYKSKK